MGRPINYGSGSGSSLDIFVAIEKNMLPNTYRYVGIKSECFLRIQNNGSGSQLLTDPGTLNYSYHSLSGKNFFINNFSLSKSNSGSERDATMGVRKSNFSSTLSSGHIQEPYKSISRALFYSHLDPCQGFFLVTECLLLDL